LARSSYIYNLMKYFTCLLFAALFVFSCGSTPGRSGIYFDQNGQAVSKEKQREIFDRNRGKLITATITNADSIEYRLVPRKEAGKISPEDNQAVAIYLNGLAEGRLPAEYLAAIVYYPGKDLCNSTGNATRETRDVWYDEMEAKLAAIDKTFVFYVYKNDEGLERRTLNRDWNQDGNRLIEQTFFKHHYPCSSFTVVDQDGNYRSYFGAFVKEEVAKTARAVKQDQ